MTSSQPPQPPLGGQPPQGQPPQGHQPPPGYQPPPQPGYGPPPGQQPPAGYGPPPTPGQNPYGQPAGSGGPSVSFDPKRLTMAGYVIAGLTLLYLILSFFTWYDFGDDEFLGVDLTVSGWSGSGNVKFAFFLFLLASVWALLPAFTDIKVGFPRSWITVGLAALGFVLTLFAWFDTFQDYIEFSIWALLGTLTAAAILVFAVLSLLPELRNRPALPGAVAGAAQWANQPAPGPGQPGQPGPGAYGQPGPAGPPTQQYAPPPPQQQYAPPPAPPAPPAAPPPPPGPSSYGPPSGGSSASGEGTGPDRPAGI